MFSNNKNCCAWSSAVLVLADDLTGALEVGAKFAVHGFGARVTTRCEQIPDVPVTVIDTETRHLSPAMAAQFIRAMGRPNAQIVYKKTDSALRGNIAAELRALLSTLPGARLSYIPAYPELGRITRAGSVIINGVPAHLSEFAHDRLNPIATSSIAELLGPDLPITIHDGETAADVHAAIAATLSNPGPQIIAGPASVAAALAAHLKPGFVAPRWPQIEKCLVICGSLHRASGDQIARALDQGSLANDPDAAWRLIAPAAPASASASDYASIVGDAVAREVDRGDWDAIMVFGGDTAFGILDRMNRPYLEPIGEIITGVPISKISGRNLFMISKAGSFGQPDVICRIKGLLHDAR